LTGQFISGLLKALFATEKVALKIRINRLQFAFRAAAFAARLFGLKYRVVNLYLYTEGVKTSLVCVLALGAVFANLSLGDSGSS
jgi:hypothetical protein